MSMKAFKRALRWALGILVVLIIGVLTLGRLVDARRSDVEIAESFQNEPVKPVVHRYRMGDRTIRYIEATKQLGDTTLPVVIFIHGAPSSLWFFEKFFRDTTLLNRARLVSVDRPGYGYSDFGRVETSIVRQAKLLQPLVDQYRKAPFVMLVGSSYGGPVAARLAMNNPKQTGGSGIDHIVFVSSANGPGLEYTYPISYLIDQAPLRWLMPPLLMLANDEKLAHGKALREILPDWPKITAGISILHGQRDELVYPTNVAFDRQQLVNARVKEFILPQNRHDIIFNKREYVTDIILEVLTNYARPILKLKDAQKKYMTSTN